MTRKLLVLASLSLFFTACSGKDAVLDDTGTALPDADGDGIIDDDDNCVDDENTDQADLDGDGSGDVCDPDADGDGYAGSGVDCDDLNADIHPDAIEVCDDIDNDCSGDIDGADAQDALTWYADSDGDSYGDASQSACLCSANAVFKTPLAGDCQDLNAAINPGAQEICDDGVDNDCDTFIDADDDDCA